jgi:hypothetical protein
MQVLDGKTVLLPNIFDPSELRSDITGKVVRYLHENGAQVGLGEAFVEVEAMKVTRQQLHLLEHLVFFCAHCYDSISACCHSQVH